MARQDIFSNSLLRRPLLDMAHYLYRLECYLSEIHLAYPSHRVHQGLVDIGAERPTMASGLDSPQLRYRYGVMGMHDVGYRTLHASDMPYGWRSG